MFVIKGILQIYLYIFKTKKTSEFKALNVFTNVLGEMLKPRFAVCVMEYNKPSETMLCHFSPLFRQSTALLPFLYLAYNTITSVLFFFAECKCQLNNLT
jgi:hypothetical protein